MSDEITRAEFNALIARVNGVENLLRDYLMKEREQSIIEFSHIEDLLRLPRTREKRVRG